MRLHTSRLMFVLALGGLLAAPAAALAQGDQTAPTGTPATPVSTDFVIDGAASVGYRATDVTGRTEKFRELFNLNEGTRLVDFSLFGRAPQGANHFADTFSATASGLGGDPYQAFQLTARKMRQYDLRVSWRRSAYFWDQSDAPLPNGQNGLTNNHSWDTVHTFGSASFLLHATNNLRVGFDVYRMSDAGTTVTTRTPDFFGSPSSWGNFARANPYVIDGPLTEILNRYTGVVDYTQGTWTVHFNGGYQTFDDTVLADAQTTPERSINLDDASTAKELLTQGAYQDFRRLTTPVSEVTYDGKPLAGLEWRGGYTFYRYSGPAGLQANYSGSERSGSTFVPYNLAFETRADVKEPTHVVEQGVTWEATDRLSVLVDYHYTHVAIDADAAFNTMFGTTLGSGETNSTWRENRNQLDTDVEFVPAREWFVRGGLRWLRNNLMGAEDGVPDPVRTSIITTVWPTFSASYKPSDRFSVRGDFDAVNTDNSFTRITPHLDVGSRFVVRVQPIDQLTIEDTLQVRNRSLDATSYKDNVRSNAVMGTYTLNDDFSLFGGYSYDRIVSSGTATFLRGPAPLDVVIDDRQIEHVWQGGVSAKLPGHVGFDVAGNYVRETGTGTITAETPRYGPLRFPYVSGTVYYEIPEFGRISLDLQHIRYTESLLTANNFHARVIMVRLTREFR